MGGLAHLERTWLMLIYRLLFRKFGIIVSKARFPRTGKERGAHNGNGTH